MSGTGSFWSGAAQGAASTSQTPLWQYVLTTLVALLAAGAGIAALVNLLTKRRLKVATRVRFQPTPLYTAEETARNGTSVVLRPTHVLRGLAPDAPLSAVSPVLDIDVTNQGERALSINEVRLDFSSVGSPPTGTAAEPARIVVRYTSGSQAQSVVERKYGLTPVGEEGAFITYVASPERADALAAELAEDSLVALAFVDVPGAPHTEWTVQETVDVLLGHGEERLPVKRVVEPQASLTLSYRLGVAASMAGRLRVSLLVDSGRSVDVGSVDLELVVPAFVHVRAQSTGR